MQDVERELPGLIQELLQAPAHRQRQLIERHYTPDCRLTHALVIGENREEIVRIFQAWRFCNRRLDVDVNEIVLSGGGRRAYCSLVQRVVPRWWPSSWDWEMLVVLDLAPGPAGTQLIAGQQDFISFGSLLSPLPLVGWAYSALLRRAAGLSISATVRLSGAAYGVALSAFKAAVLAVGVLDQRGNKVWVEIVQHVTGFNHYLAPPLFGFSLSMSVLMYLRDGPGGTKLIGKQVDYHSFESILYTTPLLGGLLQHGLRRAVSAYLINGARLASQAWPPVEAWLRRTLPEGNRKVDGLTRWLGRAWWRQGPPVSWRTVPAPYDPRL